MEFIKILSAGLIGTGVMTIFTYLLSTLVGRQYKQPEILETFLNAEQVSLPHYLKRTLTWCAHFAMGIILTCIFYYICPKQYLGTFPAAIIFGSLAAIFGVITWHILLSRYHYKAHIDYYGFLVHLIFAHFFFAFGVVGSFFYWR